MFAFLLTLVFCSTITKAFPNPGGFEESPTGCYTHASDIVFVIDSSFSIRAHDFQQQLTFLKGVVDRFHVGPNHIQVGVLSFGSSVSVNIKLNDFTDSRSLKIEIGMIPHLEDGTNTHEAIKFTHTHMFQPNYGGRPWAKHIMVLITDGLSQNTSRTLAEASMAKMKNIEIFSVGVGNGLDDFEIKSVASEPKADHVFTVENFHALKGIEKALSSAACDEHKTTDLFPENNKEDVSYACRQNVAEVVFLMDSSSSIWKPHFDAQIRFIQEVVSSFQVSPDATRIGVVAYSDSPMTLVSLTDEQTNENIHQVLANAPYLTGGTNTAGALDHVRRKLFSSANVRENVARVVVILSDGDSNDVAATKREAAKAHEEGVQIFAIGIGTKPEAEELMALASDPDDKFVFHVDNFTALSEIRELLAIKACDVAASLYQQETPYPSCPEQPTDAIFIYDRAAISVAHHPFVISVISAVTKTPGLSDKELWFGVIRDAPKPGSELLSDIELTNQWTKTNFKSELDLDSKKAGIDVLLWKVGQNYFNPVVSFDSASHRRVVVVFLDSVLENRIRTLIRAGQLKRSKVKIVVVTLGTHTKKSQVDILASLPSEHYVINVPQVKEHHHKEVAQKLLSFLCES